MADGVVGSSPSSWGSFFREVRGGAGARGVFFLEGFFFFGGTCGIAACRLLVPRPGIEPMPPAVEIRILASLVAQLLKNMPTMQKTPG